MASSEIQCSFCGSGLPATAIFCKDCGKPLNPLRALHQPTRPPTAQLPNGEASQMNKVSENSINRQSANPLQSQAEPKKRQASPLLNQFNYSAQSRASGNAAPTHNPPLSPPQLPAPRPITPNLYTAPPVASLPLYPPQSAVPVMYRAAPYEVRREMKRGLAVASLITGIVSLVFSLVVVGALFAIAGIVIGIMALVKANGEPQVYGGAGLAKGGIAASGFAVIFAVLILFVALPKLGGHRLTGAKWQRYDIGTNLLSLELPGAPKKLDVSQLDNLPPDVRSNITLMELHQSQYNDFVVTVGVIGYTDKIQYDNQRGITSMLAELRQRPEVTDVDYHTSPIGDSMLSVIGTMKVYGNLTVINGFVENHNRKAYTVLTFYLQTNKDAPAAAQRVFQSIQLK